MSSTASENPIVETQYGPIRGVKKLAATKVEYFSFQRIPYAKTPIGELRFKDSQPPTPWTEPLDCSIQGPPSWQFSKLQNKCIGSEDSLHVNVFTKNLDKNNLLPVMLYIHGGAYMRGSSGVEMYGPDYLIQKDVVYVSFNYRIGALGFISFDSPELDLPGNAGLKDQLLAMRWVVANIANFGGDPQNITLFGESAGGCSVHYHMVSKQSEGLFQRAIVMSGCVLNNWSVVPRRGFGERLAKLLGWNGQGGERGALEVLKKADPEDIVKQQANLLTENEAKNGILFPFGPVIEPFVKSNCFIPKNPIEMCREAWSNRLDILIGGNSEEGLFCLDGIKQNPSIMTSLDNFEYLVPLELDLVRTSQRCKELGKRLKTFYYGTTEPSFENKDGYLTLMTDKLFWHGLHRTLCSRVNSKTEAKTYIYRFSVDSEKYNHYRIYFCDKNVRGTAHADDLSYVFKNAFDDVPPKDSFEYRVMLNMIDLLTTFASNNGNPNGGATNDWEPVGREIVPYKCLNITNDGLEFIDLPERDRMQLWDSLYSKDQFLGLRSHCVELTRKKIQTQPDIITEAAMSVHNNNLTIETQYGPVRGIEKESLLGQKYLSFQGIPYAKPPVGELRFKAPLEPEPWTEVFDCSQQCLPCYHLDRRIQKIVGSEDSLRLNVFTKVIDTKNPLPVMVYIYGGGFSEGTSGTELYGPDFLVTRDIVLVTINYRTGALGFLCCQSPDDGIPGNAGLKDQRMAIKWVKQNIAAFGGDASKITVFGHSAGAASLHYLLISDACKDLFQRAIVMSGSIYGSWALTQQRNWVEKLAKALGWEGQGGESDALKYLQTAKPEDIVEHQEKLLSPQDMQDHIFAAFSPTIESYQSECCIIPENPLEMARKAWSNKIDIMIGGTSEEGLMMMQKAKLQPEALEHPHLFVGTVPARLNISLEQRMLFATQLKQQYYPDSAPSLENYAGYVNMMTDNVFWHALHRTILARANYASQSRTYIYRFCADSEYFNHYRIMMIDPKLRGTAHADELSYLFSNITGQVPPPDSFEYRALQTLVDVFTTFASNGNPNCERTKDATWEPLKLGNRNWKCFNIANDGISFIDFPDSSRMALWDSFYVNDDLF
ncbi:uncharacterized protein LOC129752629 [Uranotaenia lowii]|uniref:uncharacterized protein LOC129752629 n=1 Tax=Uranotaenia lowii TaxID=190385 RepID=UPI0024794836|nr:uncharacterized protein LOC129752629 [Uranotaenia lowii]